MARTPAGGGNAHRERPSSNNGQGPRRRTAPAELTSAEAFYYLKQMNNETEMVVVLQDDEQLRGHIEWYDRNTIKVNRVGEPNLLLFKHAIRYMYKAEEEDGAATPDDE